MRYRSHLMPVVFRLLASGTLLVGACATAQVRCSTDTKVGEVAPRFVIDGGNIEMPVGAFLLVRKNRELGAIHLVSVEPGNSEWLGKSVYESYFQSDGAKLLSAPRAERQTAYLNVQPSRGPGRGVYVYKPGGYKAKVGKWSFGFDGPMKMEMSDTSFWTGVGDHGYEFAPTSACNVSEIDALDNRLKWFRFDRNAHVTLPLADLPK